MRENWRQLGQLDCSLSQSLMQRSWNTCWHERAMEGLLLSASKQIEQGSSLAVPSSCLGPCHSVPAPPPCTSPAHGATVAWPDLVRRDLKIKRTLSTILSWVIPERLLLFPARTCRTALQISGLTKGEKHLLHKVIFPLPKQRNKLEEYHVVYLWTAYNTHHNPQLSYLHARYWF